MAPGRYMAPTLVTLGKSVSWRGGGGLQASGLGDNSGHDSQVGVTGALWLHDEVASILHVKR